MIRWISKPGLSYINKREPQLSVTVKEQLLASNVFF